MTVEPGPDARALARIREFCARFPEAEEDLLQDRPLFHVRRRRFAIFNGDVSPPRRRWQSFARSVHVATDPQRLALLQRDARFRPSPHHGFRGWMAFDLRHQDVEWSEIGELLEWAFRSVAPRECVAELERRQHPG